MHREQSRRMREDSIMLLIFAFVGAVFASTFEATYTDASGAQCVAFGVGDHEIDFCHGRFSR